jgi:3-hydroxyacyl-CoA dehydrogenase
MSKIVIIGDGPLARELAGAAHLAGHETFKLIDTMLSSYRSGDPTPFEEEHRDLWQQAREADLLVEAVVGHREAKRAVIIEMAGWSTAPILTATLNASATNVAQWQGEPSRIVGYSMLPPVQNAKVVEIMSALGGSEGAMEAAGDFFGSLGKEAVAINDSCGGVLPRIVASLINEAAYALTEGIASAADIDRAMQLGTNYPLGPLAWADLIGLDQVLGIINSLGYEFGINRYHPAPLLRQLVRAGRLGRASGHGFYDYSQETERG